MKKAAPGTPRPRCWALSGLYVGVGCSDAVAAHCRWTTKSPNNNKSPGSSGAQSPQGRH